VLGTSVTARIQLRFIYQCTVSWAAEPGDGAEL